MNELFIILLVFWNLIGAILGGLHLDIHGKTLHKKQKAFIVIISGPVLWAILLMVAGARYVAPFVDAFWKSLEDKPIEEPIIFIVGRNKYNSLKEALYWAAAYNIDSITMLKDGKKTLFSVKQ